MLGLRLLAGRAQPHFLGDEARRVVDGSRTGLLAPPVPGDGTDVAGWPNTNGTSLRLHGCRPDRRSRLRRGHSRNKNEAQVGVAQVARISCLSPVLSQNCLRYVLFLPTSTALISLTFGVFYLPTHGVFGASWRPSYLSTPLGDKIDRATKAERVATASWRRRWRG